MPASYLIAPHWDWLVQKLTTMKKLLLIFLLLIKPLYCFSFNYEINPYGITDKLLIQEGESKLSIEHSQQDRALIKLALRIDD